METIIQNYKLVETRHVSLGSACCPTDQDFHRSVPDLTRVIKQITTWHVSVERAIRIISDKGKTGGSHGVWPRLWRTHQKTMDKAGENLFGATQLYYTKLSYTVGLISPHRINQITNLANELHRLLQIGPKMLFCLFVKS